MTGRSGVDTAAAASGEKYCGIPGGSTGRAPALAAADDVGAATAAPVDADGGEAGAAADAGFAPPVSRLISSRLSGPRRYDNAHRDWNNVTLSSCTLRITKTRLVSPDSSLSISLRSNAVSLALSRPSRTRALSRSV